MPVPVLAQKKTGNLTLELRPAADPGCFKAEAWDETGEKAGVIMACSAPKGRPVKRATTLNIVLADSRKSRGSRVGTRLYEMLAEFACANGVRLGSDVTRTKFAESFWRKQFDKGRADHYCVTSRHRWNKNRTKILSSEAKKKCPPDDGLLYTDDGGRIVRATYSTNTRYVLKSCPAPASLEGVRRRRK